MAKGQRLSEDSGCVVCTAGIKEPQEALLHQEFVGLPALPHNSRRPRLGNISLPSVEWGAVAAIRHEQGQTSSLQHKTFGFGLGAV